MPRHNRYGWLPDEELGSLLQRNPGMLQPIKRPAAPAVVMPAVPVPTTRWGRIKSAAVAIFTRRATR